MKRKSRKDNVKQQLPAAPVPPAEIAVASAHGVESDFALSNTALTKISGIVVAIGYLFLTGPVGAPVVALLAIAALFVPDMIAPDGSFDELSKNLTGLIYEEVDKAQMTAAISLANAALAGKIKLCDNITEDFKIWERTSDADEKSRKKERLRSHYIMLTTSYEAQMITHFLRSDFRSILVPQYVMAGMRYLILIATYYHYADELELSVRGDFFSVKDFVLAQLRKDIASFTDSAIASYLDGQEKMLRPPPGRTRTWDDYNDYRNKITATGLDLLPQFRYLDPILYPHGCDDKALTRRLVTLVDTHYDQSIGRNDRKDIAVIDDDYYLLRPVMAMKQIRLSSAYAFAVESLNVLQGLYASQCVLQSIDGYQFAHSPAVTGAKTPGTGTNPRKDKTIGINCYEINGVYWKSGTRVYSPGGQLPLQTVMATIVKMQFLFEEADGSVRDDSVTFVSGLTLTAPSFSTFRQNIPATTDGVATLPSHFSDRLVEFDIFLYKYRHCYLLNWRPKSALEDLLPRQNHVAKQDGNRTMQFHAIKAGRDIKNGRLKIIKGPGFCGGDLVSLQGGQNFSFYLRKNPARWFAGAYFVRLWFVNRGTSKQSVNVTIKIVPDGNFASSAVTVSIPGVETLPNVNNLKYADLSFVTFEHAVLITAVFPAFTLSCINNSLATEILIDRIELMFAGPASRSESVA